MIYSEKEKNKIFEDINENGYSLLKNFYSKGQINKVKKSLLSMLNYIKPDDSVADLNEKYYQVKNYNKVLKGHFYDMCPFELETLQLVHHPAILDLVKSYFKTDVVFSGGPGVHMRDAENERELVGHQETHQFAKDFLFVWAPLFDAKGDQGGLVIYEKSHKHGYWQHNTKNPLGSSMVDPKILKKFKEKTVEVDSGSALLIHSRLIHASGKTAKKNFTKFVITDRICPLKVVPYLRNEDVPIKIPYPGHSEKGEDNDIDYQKIHD